MPDRQGSSQWCSDARAAFISERHPQRPGVFVLSVPHECGQRRQLLVKVKTSFLGYNKIYNKNKAYINTPSMQVKDFAK